MKKQWVSLLGLAAALLAGCASENVRITGEKRPAIPVAEVKIYERAPDAAEQIAVIETTPQTAWTEPAHRVAALEEMKTIAASLGANGVLLEGYGSGMGAMASSYSGGIAYSGAMRFRSEAGWAIFVPNP